MFFGNSQTGTQIVYICTNLFVKLMSQIYITSLRFYIFKYTQKVQIFTKMWKKEEKKIKKESRSVNFSKCPFVAINIFTHIFCVKSTENVKKIALKLIYSYKFIFSLLKYTPPSTIQQCHPRSNPTDISVWQIRVWPLVPSANFLLRPQLTNWLKTPSLKR